MKRGMTLLLALVLLLAFVPALRVSAETEYKPSQDMVDMIKQMEGFAEKPYWDNSQYSVGYGTAPRSEADRLRYEQEGISREEAEELLYYHLTAKSVSLLKMIEKFSLELTQNQFDALLSFSYNCGAGWTSWENTLRTAVIEGWTGNDFLYAMGEWCVAAGSVNTGLIRRRLREANMYLNGEYSMTVPEGYTYVQYDSGLGVCETRIQAYNSKEPVKPVGKPAWDGLVFDGWYTKRTGGDPVDKLDDRTGGMVLYAHWRAGEGAQMPQDEEYTSSAVSYNREVLAESIPILEEPVKNARVTGGLRVGQVVRIEAEFLDSAGILWGKIENNGWMNLEAAKQTEKEPDQTATVTVTAASVNVRSGPGTSYPAVGTVRSGQELTITQIVPGAIYDWGLFEDGWISLQFTDYQGQTGTPEEGSFPRMATITGNSLRIRKGPSTGNAVVGYLNKGDRVEILEVQDNGTASWGRTNEGWISMDYAVLDAVSEKPTTPAEPKPTEPEPTEPKPTEPKPTEPEPTETEPTEPEPTEPEPTEPKEDPSSESAAGTVEVNSRLRVRSGPGTGYAITGYLNNGDKVSISQRQDVNGEAWGKTELGWISLQFVRLDTPGQPQNLTVTVRVSSLLRVRGGPGTGYSIAGYLRNGDTVLITQQKTVDGEVWGKTEKGWISMAYTVSQSGEKTVTAGCLCIRKDAGVNNPIVGYCYKGDVISVSASKRVGQVTWFRTDKGWVSGDYLA